jgi:guanylate kinase
MKDRGRLIVVSAPSGAGKTSLVRALLERRPDIRFSTSYTTRQPRPGEEDGRDYHFVDEATFLRMVEDGEFLEHARVFDHLYGTGRRQVQGLMDAGHDVILEIDWQGARQVRDSMPECVTVFVLPPSIDELDRRLRGRSTDSGEVIARRLADARADMSHWDEFDYAVVNDAFDVALADLADIVDARGESSRTGDPEQARKIAAILA